MKRELDGAAAVALLAGHAQGDDPLRGNSGASETSTAPSSQANCEALVPAAANPRPEPNTTPSQKSSIADWSTPSPKIAGPSPTQHPPPTALPEAAAPVLAERPAAPGEENNLAEEEGEERKKYLAMEAKVRRICEPKQSGKVEADQALVAQWKQKGHSRTQLVQLMLEAEGKKETHMCIS